MIAVCLQTVLERSTRLVAPEAPAPGPAGDACRVGRDHLAAVDAGSTPCGSGLCPAPDEFTPVGKLPLGAPGHVARLAIRPVIERAFDAGDIGNIGDTGDVCEHTFDPRL